MPTNSQYHNARSWRRHTHFATAQEEQREAFRDSVAQLVAFDQRPSFSAETRRILPAVR